MAKERHMEHKIQNHNGQVAERNSYGRDPYPPKGLRDREGGAGTQVEAGCQKSVLDLKAP